MAKILVYVLYYNETSKAIAYNIARDTVPLCHFVPKRLEPHRLFESQFYLDDHTGEDWTNYDYVGTISYRFPSRRGIGVKETRSYIAARVAEARDAYADVVILNEPRTDKSIVEESKGHGEGFTRCWFGLLQRLGYSHSSITDSRHPVCYNNYWVAKPHVLKAYCNFVRHAWQVLQASPDLIQIFDMDAHYQPDPLTQTLALGRERLTEIFDKPYYAMYPFVFERFACFYFSEHGYKTYPDSAERTPNITVSFIAVTFCTLVLLILLFIRIPVVLT